MENEKRLEALLIEDITLTSNILSTKVLIKKITIEKLLFTQEFQLLIKKII